MTPATLLHAAVSAVLVHAQDAVRWDPPTPLEGTLVRVTVAATLPGLAPGDPPAGTLAGEPLHFEPLGAHGFTAIAAIPLGTTDSATLILRPATSESLLVRVAVKPRPAAPAAQLRAPPRFTAPPDSALAARLAAERARLAAVLRETHARPRLWSAPFLRPRPVASRVTSPFADTRGFNGEAAELRHRGADLAGSRGAPVRAANRGIVALVAEEFYGGTVVYVDHGAGLVTSYAHLSRALVAPGDTVARGQLIARVGASGRATGPHLHWGARYGRIAVDPLGLLKLPASTEAPAREQ